MQSRRTTSKPLTVASSLAAAVALAAALAGCPNKPPGTVVVSTSPPTTPPLTPAPSWQPSPMNGDGAYSDAGFAVFGGNLRVDVREDGRVMPGALVKVVGPTLATANTNAQGLAEFGPLLPGDDYRVVVETPGRATQTASNVVIKKKVATPLRVDVAKAASVRGKVLAADGKPIAGAVVSDGTNATLSGADGAWSLDGVAAGSVTLSAGKPRFQPASKTVAASVGQAASADLTLAPGQATAYFDATLGGAVGLDKLTKVRAHLGTKGWTMVDQPPAADGVWVAITPARDLTPQEVERMTTFVAQGGKLIMLGEWGGAAGFRTPAANALAHRFGLHFNTDLLREGGQAPNPAWLAISRFLPNHSAVAGLRSLQMYEGCSLFGLVPMTQLAQTGPTGYRVQAVAVQAPQTVAAGGPYKAGKAIVVGDATAFTDEDADGDGTANAAEAENLRFVEQLFDW